MKVVASMPPLNRIGNATFRLHFHHARDFTSEIQFFRGLRLVALLSHRRERDDRVNLGQFVQAISSRDNSFVLTSQIRKQNGFDMETAEKYVSIWGKLIAPQHAKACLFRCACFDSGKVRIELFCRRCAHSRADR